MRPAEAVATGPETVARALLQARAERRPAASEALEQLLASPAEAYEVQERVARASGWHADGVPRYWKSGGPGRPAVLTHAPLPEPGVWASPAEASAHDWHFNFCLIEAEIALRLGHDVPPSLAAGLSVEDAPRLVDAMTVSIELVDSRWTQGVQAAALLKLADLQSHSALVLGVWRPFEARDWAAQTCEVRIGDAPARTFRGTHSLGDPAWLLPTWLRHVTRHGATVPRGTVVTTGTWCGMLPARKGEVVRVGFEGVGEGVVRV